MLGFILASALASMPRPPADDWHRTLHWQDKVATMQATPAGFVLHSPAGERTIPRGALATDTASPLFDGLFALAQDELKQDSVEAIRDDAFDHGQPIPCACFETGEKWHYVWTRDLSYAVDLGLWRLDLARSRHGLEFKLSDVRVPAMRQGWYVMQDTGSGGSWPVSTDRVVWFLGARHLLDDRAFADKAWHALVDTLAQDRLVVFDPRIGLYRGETSFLDWREQSYPGWTANDVRFIAQSFALSTNVLHYQALRLATRLAREHGAATATDYAAQADALKAAINAHFWRADRGLYMSYIGGDGLPVEAYDLLGLALAIDSGVADSGRARQALASYPAWPAGSPVIWPERADQPIYHNRAIWPFVSAYALRAARVLDDPLRIDAQVRSLMRGAALAGSNMENFELLSQATHVDDGVHSGPVVNSPRQLWSVAGYLDMVIEGVFGLTADDRIEPKLPASLVPMLFGDRARISLQLRDRRITLLRPARLDGNLLVADSVRHDGSETMVQLRAASRPVVPLRRDAPLFAPATPPAPQLTSEGASWRVAALEHGLLYVNGTRRGSLAAVIRLPKQAAQQCLRVTRIGTDGIESLPSPEVCVSGAEGDAVTIDGAWPRQWRAPSSGSFKVALRYANDHGPINTGITAAVRMLVVDCAGAATQRVPLVLPHSMGEQRSTSARFHATAGSICRFTLEPGFNMSYLRRFAHYTGGAGGIDGPLNEATIGALSIAPLATEQAHP